MRDSLEKLRWNLIDLKNSIPALMNTGSLTEAIVLAENNKWANTLTELYKIEKACSALETSENECLIEITSFDSFVVSRNIDLNQKQLLKSSVESYGKYIQARLNINNEFSSITDALLVSSEESMVIPEVPLVTVKMAPAHIIKSPEIKKEKK